MGHFVCAAPALLILFPLGDPELLCAGILALPLPSKVPKGKKKARSMAPDPSAVRFVTAGERGVLRMWRSDTAQSSAPGAPPWAPAHAAVQDRLRLKPLKLHGRARVIVAG